MKLFQDPAGTIPASLPGHPVGLVRAAAGGSDASQATTLSKPMLARWPKSGMRNLINNNAFASTSGTVIAALAEQSGWFDVQFPAGLDRRFTPVNTVPNVALGDALVGSFYIDTASSLVPSGIQVCVGIIESHRAFGTFTVPIAGQAPILVATNTSASYFAMPTVSVEHVSGTIWRIILKTRSERESAMSGVVLQIWRAGSHAENASARLGLLQLEYGNAATQPQYRAGLNDITESSGPDLWHLYNDGGDSLPVVVPGGVYGLASIGIDRTITLETVTSDGVTPINTLRHTRQLDVILRAGAFNAGEEAQIRAYWQGVYA